MQVFAGKDAEIENLKRQLEVSEQQRADLARAHTPCPDIIAGLKKELDNVKAAHAPCEAQIRNLKGHLGRLDAELASELAKEEALLKQLSEEKRKETELEESLKKTKADLDKDERDLTEDKRVRRYLSLCLRP